MSKAQELLRRAKAYRAPTTLHPIARRAFALYEEGGDRLGPESVEALRGELLAYRDAEDFEGLADAMCGLASFIWYCKEHLKDPAAEEAVTQLIREMADVVAFLQEQIAAALQDQAQDTTKVLGRFSGSDLKERARAPKIDEARPAGTVSLASLKPAAQPPAHIKRRIGR